jgi:DNA-3-methyladenine glycosylase II
MAGSLSREARALAASDPAIADLIERLGPLSLEDRRRGRDGDPFEALARIVTAQQVSTAAARTIWQRLRDEFGGRPPSAAEAAASEQRLRSAGLSGRKASYIAGIGSAFATGELDAGELGSAGDERVIEMLTALRGLGRWSAEMFLIFHLGRPDVFSGGDLGLRNGIRLALALDATPTPERAVEIAERWRPHRTLAAIYLWAAVAVELPDDADAEDKDEAGRSGAAGFENRSGGG